jgi:hypothetical protein
VASWSTRIGGDPKGALVAGEGSKIHLAYVPAGESRFGRQHEIRLVRTLIDIKVSTQDTDGALRELQRVFDSHGLELVGAPLSI